MAWIRQFRASGNGSHQGRFFVRGIQRASFCRSGCSGGSNASPTASKGMPGRIGRAKPATPTARHRYAAIRLAMPLPHHRCILEASTPVWGWCKCQTWIDAGATALCVGFRLLAGNLQGTRLVTEAGMSPLKGLRRTSEACSWRRVARADRVPDTGWNHDLIGSFHEPSRVHEEHSRFCDKRWC